MLGDFREAISKRLQPLLHVARDLRKASAKEVADHLPNPHLSSVMAIAALKPRRVPALAGPFTTSRDQQMVVSRLVRALSRYSVTVTRGLPSVSILSPVLAIQEKPHGPVTPQPSSHSFLKVTD